MNSNIRQGRKFVSYFSLRTAQIDGEMENNQMKCQISYFAWSDEGEYTKHAVLHLCI